MNRNLVEGSLMNSTVKGVNDIANTIKETDKQNPTLAGVVAGTCLSLVGVAVGAYIAKK